MNPGLVTSETSQRLLAQLETLGTPMTEVSATVWDKLTFGDRRDGVLVIADAPVATAESLVAPQQGPVVVLDRIQKPGNIGAILRTADAAGASAVVLADPQTDLFNPNVIRASLGTVFQLPVHVDTAANLVARLRVLQLEVLVTRVDAVPTLFEIDLARPCAVVFGNEAEGVSEIWRDSKMQGVRLPMLGMADSLNVASSVAAVLYEAMRQRQATQGLLDGPSLT